jgi:DedD protein
VSKGLKQRIVGALVLGALGLIILPALFDFTAPSRIDRTTKLPPAPEISAVTVVKAERPAAVTSDVLDNAIFDVSKLIAATADEAPTALNDQSLPKRWYIKVGSFGNKANADSALTRLRNQGFKAFVNTLDQQGDRLYEIWVGPNIDKRRATADQVNIDKLLKVKSKMFAALL